MKNLNWMRRKFLQGSSLLGASWLLGNTVAAQHEGHQAKPKTAKPQADKPASKAAPPAEHDHGKMMAEQAKAATGK
ncbi:MAG: hypothetical protein HOP19_20295, partial [Acidobacteria bacterium]|nr:hypothetical protein [Acidobacteriota bacterium]